MTNEDKKIFTRRISQGNKSDIIVVLFDIYFSYEKDACRCLEDKIRDAYADAVRHMSAVVEHLKADLDFTYDIALQLFPLYDYALRCLAKALYKPSLDQIEAAGKVMKGLREAFIEVAKQDESGGQMVNAQTVTAGYTYGRNSLSEITDGENRGFFA